MDGGVERGTVIGVFDQNGNFAGGDRHVAIFWGYTTSGIFVIDQNAILNPARSLEGGIIGAHPGTANDYTLVVRYEPFRR